MIWNSLVDCVTPVIVMAEGSVLFEGTSDEVKNNEQVIESYLGRGSKLKDKS